jgi:DNA-directed RNA polymerase subunit RPC12/RpoP
MNCNYCGTEISIKEYNNRRCFRCGNNPLMRQGSLVHDIPQKVIDTVSNRIVRQLHDGVGKVTVEAREYADYFGVSIEQMQAIFERIYNNPCAAIRKSPHITRS